MYTQVNYVHTHIRMYIQLLISQSNLKVREGRHHTVGHWYTSVHSTLTTAGRTDKHCHIVQSLLLCTQVSRPTYDDHCNALREEMNLEVDEEVHREHTHT